MLENSKDKTKKAISQKLKALLFSHRVIVHKIKTFLTIAEGQSINVKNYKYFPFTLDELNHIIDAA